MNNTETAVLAGGCFWGMQDLIRKLPGVISSRSWIHRRRCRQRNLQEAWHSRRSDLGCV